MTTTRTTPSAPRWRAVLAVLAGLTVGFSSTSALAADEVRLLKAVSTVGSKYGQTWQDTSYTLLVKNLAYTKQVSIHLKQPDGSWTDLAASYVGPAGSGVELWRATKQYATYNVPPDALRDLEFVAKYTVNGQTYWDNNGGANYRLGQSDGPLLNGVNVLVDSSFWRDTGDLDVSIDLKNLAYTKNVTVVYTTDNWATSHEAAASHVIGGYTLGYAYIQSPNAKGVERWLARIPAISGTQLRFYVRYQVNGQTYWDSNFGQDYRHSR